MTHTILEPLSGITDDPVLKHLFSGQAENLHDADEIYLNESMSEWAVLLVASIYWAASLATGPAWNTWQGTVIPHQIRAKFYARRSRI